jgi:hypothetical protein
VFKAAKVLCWVGVIAIAAILLIALTQEVPTKSGTGHWETEEVEQGRQTAEIQRWVGEPDWDKVSWEVRIGRQYFIPLLILGVLLLSVALMKQKN